MSSNEKQYNTMSLKHRETCDMQCYKQNLSIELILAAMASL